MFRPHCEDTERASRTELVQRSETVLLCGFVSSLCFSLPHPSSALANMHQLPSCLPSQPQCPHPHIVSPSQYAGSLDWPHPPPQVSKAVSTMLLDSREWFSFTQTLTVVVQNHSYSVGKILHCSNAMMWPHCPIIKKIKYPCINGKWSDWLCLKEWGSHCDTGS